MTTTAFATPQTVRLRSTRDVLAAIPYVLGYRPAECAVVVGIAADGRLGPLAHVALADLPAAGTAGVRMVAQRVAGLGAARAVVGVYTGLADPAGDGARAVVDPLVAAVEAAVGDVDAWLVTPDGFRGLHCADLTCCPPGGHPRADLDTGAVSAAFVLTGSSVAPTAAEAFRIPRAPEPSRELAGRAARRCERAAAAAGADRVARRAWEHDGRAAWRDAVRHVRAELALEVAEHEPAPRRGTVPPASLGRLVAALADTAVRDAVLLDVVAEASSAAGGDGSALLDPCPDIDQQAAEACGRLLDPGVAAAPDRTATSVARTVLEAAVAHAPRRLQVAPLTLLALVAWWRGEGGLATARVREALEIDDSYRLALLVGDILAAAVPPGWVGRSWAEQVG